MTLLTHKLYRNMLCAIMVKFDVLVSFFINGKNQEEGSSAISVKRRMNNKSWQVWLVIMTPHLQMALHLCCPYDVALITTRKTGWAGAARLILQMRKLLGACITKY